MNNNKHSYRLRSLSLLVLLCLTTLVLMGCSSSREKIRESSRLKIVTTLFSEYDWVQNIIGSNSSKFDVKLLVDNGVDLHSYQPTADDIITISTCDLFIYNGGESDSWVKDTLNSAANKNLKVLDMMSVLGDRLREEEVVEGMQTEASGGEEKEYDEHIWLSVRNAKLLCTTIEEAISSMDSKNKEIYDSNLDSYLKKLDELDEAYNSAVNGSTTGTLIFADRFPFRYLASDYGINYYAAFSGCSAECEASFETVSFLAGKVDELNGKALLILENTSPSLADTILAGTVSKDAVVLTVNSMQSVTKEEISKGISYLDIMKSNLEVIKQALK